MKRCARRCGSRAAPGEQLCEGCIEAYELNPNGEFKMPMNRTTLTKSLHTVTAVSRLAHYLTNPALSGKAAFELSADQAVRNALVILGQLSDWPETDPTFAACVAKVRAMRGAS